MNNFNRKGRGFTVSTNLAELWATGQPDEPIVGEWAKQVRASMQGYLRPDALPVEGKTGPALARVVTNRTTNALTPELVQLQGTNIFRSNIVSILKVRKDLLSNAPPSDQALARFLGGFIKENCVLDLQFTRQSRLEKSQPMMYVDNYTAGTNDREKRRGGNSEGQGGAG